MVKISSLPAYLLLPTQVQADIHQTFRVCLRYTIVILEDPRRHLRERQLSRKPLTWRYSESLVDLLIRETPPVGEDVNERANENSLQCEAQGRGSSW